MSQIHEVREINSALTLLSSCRYTTQLLFVTLLASFGHELLIRIVRKFTCIAAQAIFPLLSILSGLRDTDGREEIQILILVPVPEK